MPVAVTVTVDKAQIDRIQRELAGVPRGLQRVLVGAINKVLPKARTVIVNGLTDLLTVKRGNVFGRTNVDKATATKPFGTVRVLGRRIALINFDVKEKRKKKGWGTAASGSGVTARAYKGGAAEVFPHAFIAVGRKGKSGKGNRHVFERASPGGKRAKRFPLWSRKGLSLLDVYREHPELHAAAEDKIQAALGEAVESQVDRILGRAKSDRPTSATG